MLLETKLTTIKIANLKCNQKNPRIHSKKQESILAKAVEHFKFLNPPIVDQHNNILAGNLRYDVAKLLGLEEIQVLRIDHLSDDDIRAFIIAENKIAEMAGWDQEVLKLELQYLTDIGYDICTTGFELAEIDLIINEAVITNSAEDDFPEAADIKTHVKKGDIIALGEHKLINGNALDRLSYVAIMGDSKANMAFVDYPYNVKINGNVTTKKHFKEFENASGEMSKPEFTEFLKKAMILQKEFSAVGSIHFGCMDWKHIEEIITAGNAVFDELKNVCIWDKGTAGMGSLYRSQHEMIFVFKNGTAPHINNIQLGKYGRYRTNIWNYPGMHVSNPKAAKFLQLHPTVKPTALIMDAILDCSKPNDIILDSFAGSGSTLIAAEKLQRKARLIEIDKHYCDVIITRWEQLTGQRAEVIGNLGGIDNV